jgi:hypothetical protein
LADTGLSGLALCLFGGDIPEGGMEPLTIVVSFDVGEQVVPGGGFCRFMAMVRAAMVNSARPLAHMLKNRFYIGEIVWGGGRYELV